MRSIVTRLGVTAAAVVGAALAGVLVASPTASATVQNRCFLDGYFNWDAPGVIGAYLTHECVNPESATPVNLTIQRYMPSTDTWTTVATGRGHAAYHCVGTAPGYFHMTALPDDYILIDCG
jgi:hypothetical protein